MQISVSPEQGGMECFLGCLRLCLLTPRFWESELMLQNFREELLEFGEKGFDMLNYKLQCNFKGLGVKTRTFLKGTNRHWLSHNQEAFFLSPVFQV